MSRFYRRWPVHPETDYRPGLEKITTLVEIPSLATKGTFATTRTGDREDFFSSRGAYRKRLERIAKLAEIGAVGPLLHASGLWIASDVLHAQGSDVDILELETASLAAIRRRTHQLAKPGVVTSGPRMRVSLHTTSNLFSMRSLVTAIHERKSLISCVTSDDPEVVSANEVERVHDILEHVPAALVRSDEVVQLEVEEAGKRLQGLAPDKTSQDVHDYASTYDDTSTVAKTHALLNGDTTNYSDWQHLWGVNDTAMDGIVERWREQLDGIVIPDSLHKPI